MRFSLAVMTVLFLVASCMKDITTLKGAYEAEADKKGYHHHKIIDIKETGNDGFVLGTMWGADFPQNEFSPFVARYEKGADGKWSHIPGIACDGPGAKSKFGADLGIHCGTFNPIDRPYKNIGDGNNQATIFQLKEDLSVWWMIAPWEANIQLQ